MAASRPRATASPPPPPQKTDLGRFIYANSITLPPGTVTTGIVGDDFEVHAIVQEEIDGSEENDMNRRVAVLEGEGA